MKVDGIFFDIVEQFIRDTLQFCFGITHRRRTVSVHASEIALWIDQRIAQGPILGHPHHGIVDRPVAMRMILTQHFPDDPG